jgi:hypothetical protein
MAGSLVLQVRILSLVVGIGVPWFAVVQSDGMIDSLGPLQVLCFHKKSELTPEQKLAYKLFTKRYNVKGLQSHQDTFDVSWPKKEITVAIAYDLRQHTPDRMMKELLETDAVELNLRKKIKSKPTTTVTLKSSVLAN